MNIRSILVLFGGVGNEPPVSLYNISAYLPLLSNVPLHKEKVFWFRISFFYRWTPLLKSETVSTIKPRIAGFYPSSQAKGTNSTSFLMCVRNEVELVPLACEDGFYLKIYNVPSPVTFSESTKANEPLPRCGRDMFRCTLQRVLHSSKHALAASGRLYPISLAEEGVGDTTHTVTYMYEITLYMLGIFIPTLF